MARGLKDSVVEWSIEWWWNDGMFRNGGMLVSMQNNLNEMLEMLEMLEIESKRIEMVQDVRLIGWFWALTPRS